MAVNKTEFLIEWIFPITRPSQKNKMKVTREKKVKEFIPVIITLESNEELEELYKVVSNSNKCYDLYSELDELIEQDKKK